MSPTIVRLVNAALVAAIVVDLVLPAMTLLAPDLWFSTLHGTAPDAMEVAFLRRCGANWFAFAGLQILALWRWREGPHWLAVIAGVRLSDVLTDVTYLAASPTVLPAAFPGLVLPLFLNFGMGVGMLYAHRLARD